MLIAWWVSAISAETVHKLNLKISQAFLGADLLQPPRIYSECIEGITCRLFQGLRRTGCGNHNQEIGRGMSADRFPVTLTKAGPPVDAPGKLSHGELRKIVAISIGVLAAPFILWGVWILVSRRLRAWRVRSATPGLHCIGTWSGGLDAENHAETLRTRQIRKANSRSDRFSTDFTAGHSRIIYDASREKRGTHARGRRKSILRLLPSWTRDHHGGSAINTTTSLNSLSLAEEGNLVTYLLG